MRGLRSGLALHALAVHAERDQPPTRPTHTPIVRRARALIAPVQDISRFIRIWRRASRSDRFRRWPTTVAAPCAEVPLPLSGQGFSISQEYSGLLQGVVARRQDRHRSGMANRVDILHSWAFLHPNPETLRNQEE